MRIIAALTALGALCLPGVPVAAQGLPPRVADSMNDAAILGLRAIVDQSEIETARLAAQRSSSPQVRAFTQSLLRGHSTAQNTAAALAVRLKIERKVPGDSDSAVTTRHRTTMATLRGLHGAAFDHAFLVSVRNEHVEEIARVNDWYTPGAQRDSVKAYLIAIMPTLEKHRDTAERLLRGK
ncbi:MAG: DUF4142 domain-containing protein [Gemmatimonadales bacterium]